MKSVRLNDSGFSVRLRIIDDDGDVVDISTASVKRFDFNKPDRTTMSKTASFYTDGTDGILTYITSTDEINQLGIWEIQAYLEIGSGVFRSTIVRFRVAEIINS